MGIFNIYFHFRKLDIIHNIKSNRFSCRFECWWLRPLTLLY